MGAIRFFPGAFTVLMALAVPSITSAQSAPSLQSAATGQCLDVSAASLATHTNVVQWACNNAPNQQWRATSAGGYTTLTAVHSGQCLDIAGASMQAGAQAIQWTCSGATNQQFTLRTQGNGFAIVARHSGMCLGLENNGTSQGSRVTQQACNSSASQTWAWSSQASPPPVVGIPSDQARQGSWSALQALSIVPVAAAHLPDGKILFWSGSDRFSFDIAVGRTYTSVWDPATGAASDVLVSNTDHDMFCTGIANLPDGRIHVTGGAGSSRTSIYDPATGAWVAGSPMNIARGYQGSVTMSTGDVLTMGGSWSGGTDISKDGEIWSSASGAWRRVPALLASNLLTGDKAGLYRADNHGWLFAASDGRVFHAGPGKAMHWFQTSGNGAVTAVGNRGADDDAMNGNAVMFDVNRILTIGGATSYEDAPATANAHLIDIGGSTPKVTKLPSMAYARTFSNSVVLPDGKVLVIGGQSYAALFNDDRSALAPELFDPATQSFSVMAAMSVPRNYHSTALLLPDGRVVAGGGGLCGSCTVNHPDIQVWSPPYLFNPDGTPATRPVLTTAPAQATAGSTMTVATDSPVSSFSLVRMSSVTHSVNNEQRRVPLSFTVAGTNGYALALPADRGILVPGYYMLFALNSTGVPSVARIVRIS
ncbi:MAG TPA: RICIN domain-containing protein [Burkholderiaceae bacterium]|nr:RICIN domain-containing protein [Burkholderiaceae bacterium]